MVRKVQAFIVFGVIHRPVADNGARTNHDQQQSAKEDDVQRLLVLMEPARVKYTGLSFFA